MVISAILFRRMCPSAIQFALVGYLSLFHWWYRITGHYIDFLHNMACDWCVFYLILNPVTLEALNLPPEGTWIIHWCQIMHILGRRWFRHGLVAWSVSCHFLNQFCMIINLALVTKLQWDLKQSTKNLPGLKINHLKMPSVISTILFRPSCDM